MKPYRQPKRAPKYRADVTFTKGDPAAVHTDTLMSYHPQLTAIGAQRLLRRKYADPSIKILGVRDYE